MLGYAGAKQSKNDALPKVQERFGLGTPDTTDSLGLESASLSLDGVSRDDGIRRRNLVLFGAVITHAEKEEEEREQEEAPEAMDRERP